MISLVDGTAVSTLTSICSGSGPSGSGLTAGVDVADPLTGSASSASATPLPLPPFSCDDETKWWVDHADAVVCGDGTIFLYLFGPVHRRSYYLPAFNAALLRPGDTAWTMVHKQYLGISFIGEDPCSCIAHHDGKIVARYRNWCSYYIETRQVPPPVGNPIAISLWQGIAGQLPLGVSRGASSSKCPSKSCAQLYHSQLCGRAVGFSPRAAGGGRRKNTLGEEGWPELG